MLPAVVALAALGQAVINAGRIVAESFCKASRAAYIESGAVYGETDEGFLRWLGELSEAVERNREKQKALDRESKAFVH
ncbi:MAG TPA: hypothetical protein VGB00_08550 [Pyrinomonadaceae bacterium]